MITVSTQDGPVELTQKQFEILQLAAAHFQNKEIASKLGLSPRTVEDHIRAARTKLGVSTRAAAIRLVANSPKNATRGSNRVTQDGGSRAPPVPPEGQFDFHDTGHVRPAPWLEKPVWQTLAEEFRKLGKIARLFLVFGIAAATLMLVGSGLTVVEMLSRMAFN